MAALVPGNLQISLDRFEYLVVDTTQCSKQVVSYLDFKQRQGRSLTAWCCR